MIPHYELTGDGPPLVLPTSRGATTAMWNPNVKALAKHFQVTRYDTRGHGRSETPVGPYTIDDVGNDVGELLDELGHDRAHFVGLSLGGMTGMWLGMHAPARIEKLVLLCTSRGCARPRRGPTARSQCARRARRRPSTAPPSAGSPTAPAPSTRPRACGRCSPASKTRATRAAARSSSAWT